MMREAARLALSALEGRLGLHGSSASGSATSGFLEAERGLASGTMLSMPSSSSDTPDTGVGTFSLIDESPTLLRLARRDSQFDFACFAISAIDSGGVPGFALGIFFIAACRLSRVLVVLIVLRAGAVAAGLPDGGVGALPDELAGAFPGGDVADLLDEAAGALPGGGAGVLLDAGVVLEEASLALLDFAGDALLSGFSDFAVSFFSLAAAATADKPVAGAILSCAFARTSSALAFASAAFTFDSSAFFFILSAATAAPAESRIDFPANLDLIAGPC